MISQLILTLSAGFAGGWIFHRLKVPGGMLVGAVLGVAVLSIGFEAAYMPPSAKVLAQLVAGAFIGATVDKDDLHHLRRIIRPALIILSTYLALNIAVGFLVWAVSPLDLATALFAAVPGGISDVPLIAADMGASPARVAVLQFVRLAVGVGVFPAMIGRLCPAPAAETGGEAPARAPITDRRPVVFLVTLAVAAVCGLAGHLLRIPAGVITLSMLGVLALKLAVGMCWLPMWSKRVAQVLSGACIGCTVSRADLLEMGHLLLPMAIIVLGYTVNCFAMSWLLRRFCGMSPRESMLASTPAGAGDMALISGDLGVSSPDLIVLQIIRLVGVIGIFPQVMGLILRFAH